MPIRYWNDVALEANRASHTNGKGEQTGPPLSAQALAIVYLAMYEAENGQTSATFLI
jgi:vanadium chloroperoxidase